MASTSFDKVYKIFLRKIEDKDLPLMDKQEQKETLLGYLEDALGYISSSGLKMDHDLTDYDPDLEEFNSELNLNEINALSMYMVAAWYEPIINSLSHTLMFWGSKDERYSNQMRHLKSMEETQERYLNRGRKYFRDHSSRNNKYLKEDGNG